MRMQNILTSIISHDQIASVKETYIGETVRLISDILEHTEDNNMGGILFSADFEKAFDSVEHIFVFATVQKLTDILLFRIYLLECNRIVIECLKIDTRGICQNSAPQFPPFPHA